MHVDRRTHACLRLLWRGAGSDAPRQIGRVRREIGSDLLDDDQEAAHQGSFSWAWSRILFSVPGARSSLGCPATVTRPGFVGCLNCMWLPRVATSNHPSSRSSRKTSRNFITPAKPIPPAGRG